MDRAGRIAAQLGMPHGTANNKLRKNIMFDMCRRLGENFCFKCGTEIEKVDDLSVEHKIPWEGKNAELFWSLDNIAFSHLQCNRPHKIPTNKIERPEGMNWCSGCRDFVSVNYFAKDASRMTGLAYYCKDCHPQYRKRQKEKRKAAVV